MASGSSESWKSVVDHVRRRRASRVYMPAALLAAIDVISERPEWSGHIPFPAYEGRFRELMQAVSQPGGRQAWQPFYHLSGGTQVWQLVRGDEPVLFSERPKSRRVLLDRVDGARLAEGLLRELRVAGGLAKVRELVLALLESDGAEDSSALVRAYRGLGAD